MSKEQPMKLSIDPSTIINLKAELLKKQEEFRLKKLGSTSAGSNENEYEAQKTLSTWGKKSIAKSKNSEEKLIVETKISSSQENNETEDEALKKSKKMLESKARYYEQVTSGLAKTEKDDEEIFLVNFDKKIVDKKADEESEKEKKEKENKLKFKTEISESDFNEQLRLKWEKEKYENLEKISVRYQDIKYDEIRNLGVGNFKFSRDEQERQMQMEFFSKLHMETRTNRIENEIYNLKREKLLKERLSKVKQRRLLKHGYSLAEIKELCPFDQEIDEIEQEISELEEMAKHPEQVMRKPEHDQIAEEDTINTLNMKKKINFDREWDKPKLKEKFWEKHVEKLRSERRKQFAPPSAYDNKKKQHARAKKPKQQPVKETQKKTESPKKSDNSSGSYDFFTYPPPVPDISMLYIPQFFQPNLNIPPPNFKFQAQNFHKETNQHT